MNHAHDGYSLSEQRNRSLVRLQFLQSNLTQDWQRQTPAASQSVQKVTVVQSPLIENQIDHSFRVVLADTE